MTTKTVVGFAVFWSVVLGLFGGVVFAINGDLGGGDGFKKVVSGNP